MHIPTADNFEDYVQYLFEIQKRTGSTSYTAQLAFNELRMEFSLEEELVQRLETWKKDFVETYEKEEELARQKAAAALQSIRVSQRSKGTKNRRDGCG